MIGWLPRARRMSRRLRLVEVKDLGSIDYTGTVPIDDLKNVYYRLGSVESMLIIAKERS